MFLYFRLHHFLKIFTISSFFPPVLLQLRIKRIGFDVGWKSHFRWVRPPMTHVSRNVPERRREQTFCWMHTKQQLDSFTGGGPRQISSFVFRGKRFKSIIFTDSLVEGDDAGLTFKSDRGINSTMPDLIRLKCWLWNERRYCWKED